MLESGRWLVESVSTGIKSRLFSLNLEITMVSTKSTKSTVTKGTNTKNTKSMKAKSLIKSDTSKVTKKDGSQMKMIDAWSKSTTVKEGEKSTASAVKLVAKSETSRVAKENGSQMKMVDSTSSSKPIAKRKIWIAAILIGLIVVMGVGVIISFKLKEKIKDISVQTVTTTVPPPPKTISQLPNISEKCREEFGFCWTFDEAFVSFDETDNHSQCYYVVCKSLTFTPVMVNISNSFRLEFIIDGNNPEQYREEEQKRFLKVPHYTPCLISYLVSKDSIQNRYGWCINKKCIRPTDVEELALLNEYSRIARINGMWEFHQNSTQCFMSSEFRSPDVIMEKIFWKDYYMNNQICSNKTECSPFAISFRSCTNPQPQLQGRRCWIGRGQYAFPIDYPIVISKNCSGICPKPIDTIPLNCSSFKKLENYSDPCIIHSDNFAAGKADTDFRPCCFNQLEDDEDTNVRPGLCLLGKCIPFNVTSRFNLPL